MNIQVLKRVNCSCISGIKKNELKKIKETFLVKTDHFVYKISSGDNKKNLILGLISENGRQF